MADEIVTRQQLVNASKDADSLQLFISGSDVEDVLTRLGQIYPTLAKLVRILMETGGWKAYKTESELLATTPVVNPSVGYAFDTKKLYLWNGTSWADEGLSPVDVAKEYALELFNQLSALIVGDAGPALEIAKDKTGMPYRVTKENGDIISTAKSLQFYDFNILTDDKDNMLLLLDKLAGVIFRIDKTADLHIPADLKFDNGKSLIENINNILESVNNTKVSSEKLFKKHAGLTYQQALVNRLPERSEFTSVMTLAESNGLINRMMSGVKTPTGLFLVWHQKTKPEYDGDTSGSAFWCGFADIDSNYNITVRDKKVFIYPDTDAGIIKHPHLGRTTDNRLILVYEKSIGKVEGPINYTRYVRYSLDEGVTWTDPVALSYTNSPPTTASKALGTTCEVLKLSTGRLIVPLYSINGHCGCIYSDNNGASWTYSDKFVLESNWGFEPSIALDSNDDLIMTMRPTSNNPMFAAFAKSNDHGVTWELMHKDRVVSVTNQSHLSYDKTLGVHFDSHDINPLNRRTNYRISLSYDDCYTFPLSYAPFADDRYVGYTQIIKWADGVYLLLMEYNDIWISANQNEQLGIQLFTISEIINNVTSS
ncbi:sialidase family protein [Acinetobacter baumannii]|uniref:sialidase family protein n=1 Tax=Acinetobacter baumannii TaxID=470 RepID=UPI003892709E